MSASAAIGVPLDVDLTPGFEFGDTATGDNGAILGADGTVIRELTGPDRPGISRVAWDLRMAPDSAASAGQEGRPRRPTMNDVEPGEFTVKLTARGRELTQTVMVIPDKRRRPK